MTPTASRISDADIETSPLNAVRTALLAVPSPETFSAACDALAEVADTGDKVDRGRFLDCVDRAQSLAWASGLMTIIGQDAVQAIMAQAFRHCRVHHRPPLESPPRRDDEAVASTVEALMLMLRERGTAALSERVCLDRLASLSSSQISEIIGRLRGLQPRYPKIDDELLLKLGELL